MAKKRKATKPEVKLPVDPNSPMFQPGDEIVVKRPNFLWSGHRGSVVKVDGGMCRCRISGWNGCDFHADIPAADLALDL